MPLPKKVLVANRGEIAVRVIRGCHELGIATVAVYSDADALSLPVRLAGQAVHVGPAPSSQSYLRTERILEAAQQAGADAIHPGYGFLSENAGFAQAVIDAGLTWVGPPPSAIAAMGSKTESRELMQKAGVPVVPGTIEAIRDAEEAATIAAHIGYPVMLKAAAGGGGKGMRRVDDPKALAEALRSARGEAKSSFGDDAVYIEKFVVNPRHVEVQVLADLHGAVVHCFERDCSIQRRHQKVIEETPCPVLDDDTRRQMTAVAVQAAEAVGYQGAGTVEFLLGADGSFYFLEMNTRLQVEHPITEAVVGIDLVKAQLRVAGGEPLWFQQGDLEQHGHAFECRVYAEDAANNWAPSPGQIVGYTEPGGPWVRVDSGVYEGAVVPVDYDPMIAKLVVWGHDREDARQRMKRALSEYQVRGIRTSIGFFRALLDDPDFVENRIDTGYLTPERIERLCDGQPRHDEVAVIAAAIEAHDRAMDRKPTATIATNPSRWRWSLR